MMIRFAKQKAKRVGLNKTPHRRWRLDGDARCSVFKDRGAPLSMGLTEGVPLKRQKKGLSPERPH